MNQELVKELMNLNNVLSTQIRTQSHIVYGLLNVLPADDLDKLQFFFEAQSKTLTQSKSVNESCNAALELIRSLKDEQPIDKSRFKVINGGMKD